jgi:putative peptidoglycan lipid II flippase
VLAEPITRLIYVRGGFGRADAAQSARILQAYVIAMWAYCSYQILVRAFYSLKDTLTPLKISVTLMVLELVLVLSLVWHLGPLAFGITTATVFTLNALTLALLLRRRIGNVGARSLVTSVARSLLATAAMVGIIVFLRWVLPDSPALVVSVCVPAGAAVFIAAAWLLRAPELGEMLGSLGRKRKLDEPPTDADAPTPEGNDNEA